MASPPPPLDEDRQSPAGSVGKVSYPGPQDSLHLRQDSAYNGGQDSAYGRQDSSCSRQDSTYSRQGPLYVRVCHRFEISLFPFQHKKFYTLINSRLNF